MWRPVVIPRLLLLGRGESIREESVCLESESMASVTLKNIKKIYPFSGDDIKRNKRKAKAKKKSKWQLRLEEAQKMQEQMQKNRR